MKTITPGIHADAHGYRVKWSAHGHPHEKHFPPDTPLAFLKQFRARQTRAVGAHAVRDGSFLRMAVRWLMKPRRKKLTSFKSDRAHLRVWIHRFRHLSTFAITRVMIQDAIDFWDAQGYSPRELRHRWRILHQFFSEIDPDGTNPCTGVKLKKVVVATPQTVGDDVVLAVALQLMRQEVLRRLRDGKTRARFLVLATTGVRPIQLMRASAVDVNLVTRLWVVHPAKGDKGTVIYLNDEMLAAWYLFIQAQAWGEYDGRSFSKTLHRNGWPQGIRPYNARHGVGQALKHAGVDLGNIQDHLGHRSPVTTSTFYQTPDLKQLQATSEALAGRLGTTAYLPALPRMTSTNRRGRNSTEVENPRDSASGTNVAPRAGAAPHALKTA